MRAKLTLRRLEALGLFVYDPNKMGGGKPYEWPPTAASEPSDPLTEVRR